MILQKQGIAAEAPIEYVDDVLLPARFGGAWVDALPLWRRLRLYQLLTIEARIPNG